MVASQTPGFQLGDRAWTREGVTGLVTASRFLEEVGLWEHLLEGLVVFIPEFLLFRFPPDQEVGEIPEAGPDGDGAGNGVEDAVPPPEEPVQSAPPAVVSGFVTHDEMREFVVTLVRGLARTDVTQVNLDVAIQGAIDAANLTAFGNLERVRGQLEELESTVTTRLAAIENRGLELDSAAEGDEGGGLLGFFGRVGAVIRNPVDWFTDKIVGFLIQELKDGNNR